MVYVYNYRYFRSFILKSHFWELSLHASLSSLEGSCPYYFRISWLLKRFKERGRGRGGFHHNYFSNCLQFNWHHTSLTLTPRWNLTIIKLVVNQSMEHCLLIVWQFTLTCYIISLVILLLQWITWCVYCIHVHMCILLGAFRNCMCHKNSFNDIQLSGNLKVTF